MFIDIKGTGFVNKGAELMLHAILQKNRMAFPDASFVMTPTSNNDYIMRARLGLFQKLWYQRYGIQLLWAGQFIPKSIRRRYGLILDKELDVVFDATGFGYSDDFGPSASRNTSAMADLVKKWKKNQTKVFLLPQAMGPFTSPKTRKSIVYIIENSDLVFLRDEISYAHVTNLVGRRSHVRIAPDFTNLVAGVLPEDPQRFTGRFCLVPNYRMINKISNGQKSDHVEISAMCIKALVNLGQKPFILIHELKKDTHLAEKIVGLAGVDVEIITEPDALRIKGILSLCAGVIGSRYHALVSALNEMVPILATSWSHKYEMLLKDYGITDACLLKSGDKASINDCVERLIDPDFRNKISNKIGEVNKKRLQESEDMWQTIFSIIKE
jgi:polysaccharide pyruvyl transferase WcaK-like protein